MKKGDKVKIISGPFLGCIGQIISKDHRQDRLSYWVDVCRKGKVSLWANRLIERPRKRRPKMSETDNGWSGTGYGTKVPQGSGSELFYMRKIGQQIKVRLMTFPHKYDGPGATAARPFPKAAWGAILKNNSAEPGVDPRAIILTENGDVYETIGELYATHGDLTKYDLLLTKQEKTNENGWKSADIKILAKDDGPTEAEIEMANVAQVATPGQIETTMAIVTGKRSAPKSPPVAASADYDPELDPFAQK